MSEAEGAQSTAVVKVDPAQVPVVPAPKSRSDLLREAYLSAVVNPAIDVERLQMLDAGIRAAIEDERAVAFAEAMANCQGEMKVIAADAYNTQTKSKYAKYAQLDLHLRPIYTKHGFSVDFDEADSPRGNDYLRVLGFVTHSAGHSKAKHYDVPIITTGMGGKVNMTLTHARKSALTYGKHAVLAMMFNIAVGDGEDDGNAAGGKIEQKDESLIGDKQIAVVNNLITEAGFTTEEEKTKYLAFIKVESVDEITQDQYSRVVTQLTQRKMMRQEQAKAASDQKLDEVNAALVREGIEPIKTAEPKKAAKKTKEGAAA